MASVRERFDAKVDRNGPVPEHCHELGPCWLWTGARKKSVGYGNFWLDGHVVPAHRVAWELEHGSITGALLVLHRCDNPLCVRPDHLFLGTHADNAQDAKRKGRLQSARNQGEAHGMAKLTERDVVAIRALQADGYRRDELAARFGVCVTTIGNVVNRRKWAHVA